jgi:hypothetical protein
MFWRTENKSTVKIAIMATVDAIAAFLLPTGKSTLLASIDGRGIVVSCHHLNRLKILYKFAYQCNKYNR